MKKTSGEENPLQIQSSQLEEWHSLDAFQLGLTPFLYDLRSCGTDSRTQKLK